MIEKKDNSRIKGILAVIVASALWSTGGLFIKLTHWNPVAIAGSRSLVAALVLLAYGGKPKFRKTKAQIYGTISYASMVLCFVVSNKLTTSANAILLQFTAPIFVAILGFWILKEKVYRHDIISIIIVFLGMMLFFVGDVDKGSIIGNLVAILSGLSLAGVTVSLRMQKDGSGIETTIFGNILTFLVSIPFILKGLPDTRSLIIVVIMGIFQLGIPYIFYTNSVKYLSALDAILLTVVEPLLNPVWVFIFAGEKPSIYAIIGGAIVIIAVLVRGRISATLES